MYLAKGAKAVLVTLGATLVAVTLPLPSWAEDSAGTVSGISGGDVRGISGGDVYGISGGDVYGISGGDVRGISGGDARGISGGDLRGISGGDVYGISGGDVRGISGGDLRGISGGDVYGISGGDVRGISGGDARGISGGDLRGISGGDVYGISGGDARGISGGDLLAGPVDSIDRTNGVFESMGQIVMASQSMLSTLKVGEFVSVRGSVVAAGWLYADDISVSSERYIPGSTRVFVSGLLNSVNTRNGTAQMGGLTIDYTPSLGAGRAPAGALWGFHGIIPQLRGVMISEGSSPR